MKPFKDNDPHWNRCDICGRYIPLTDLDSGKANRRMVTPDTAFTSESYETLCKEHYKPVDNSDKGDMWERYLEGDK